MNFTVNPEQTIFADRTEGSFIVNSEQYFERPADDKSFTRASPIEPIVRPRREPDFVRQR
jgi:hypothetical protein